MRRNRETPFEENSGGNEKVSQGMISDTGSDQTINDSLIQNRRVMLLSLLQISVSGLWYGESGHVVHAMSLEKSLHAVHGMTFSSHMIVILNNCMVKTVCFRSSITFTSSQFVLLLGYIV